MRADRLVSLVLLLQARGRTTARALATELGVSTRTVYRDLEGLSAAGVPVFAESGPGGGCQLLDGYRFPLRGLHPEEAEALLILGVPSALRDLGLDAAITKAHDAIRVTAGLNGAASDPGGSGLTIPLVYLDMPRWFRSNERLPHLRMLAEALRQREHLELRYRRDANAGEDSAQTVTRIVAPLGLVNKAGTWYLVAATRTRRVTVFRVGRVTAARVVAEPVTWPSDFDLAEFWTRWSRQFVASRPRTQVRLRASPLALAAFPEIFGNDVHQAIAAALPPDDRGWRELTLWFEHERAAAYRLAGFGAEVRVLSPAAVREQLLATAHGILDGYGGPQSEGLRESCSSH